MKTAAPTRTLRLLVIDDDPLLTESMRLILGGDGHDVTTADGGADGIATFEAACSTHPFQIVITDLGMPHMDGRAVAAAVKKISPSTPVILLTGSGQRLATEQNVPPCVDRLLSKPPKLQDLRRTLAELAPVQPTA